MDFNKIVNKMFKKWWKVLFKEDIFEIIDPEKKAIYQNKVDKLIYRLRSEWIIINLKSGVYIVPDLEDSEMNIVDLTDKYYLKLLKKYITFYVWSSYYISWNKSLEIHNKDFSVPEKVFIINRSINKKIKFLNYEIIFKTISCKKSPSNWPLLRGMTWKSNINLYSRFSKFSIKKNIENIDFKVSCLELALVESSIISDSNNPFDITLINKTIKKYKKVLNKNIFYEIWNYKYIMSFNRLKELSKNIDKDLYSTFLDIIKKNWWLFIWEWLRWI